LESKKEYYNTKTNKEEKLTLLLTYLLFIWCFLKNIIQFVKMSQNALINIL
jgi:hypothetical protein